MEQKVYDNYDKSSIINEGILLEDRENREIIKRSWQRCLKLKIDPGEIRQQSSIAHEKVEEIVSSNWELTNVVNKVMDHTYQKVKNTNCILIYVNNNFEIIRIIGNEHILDKYSDKLSIFIGANWSERFVGNTAISSSIIEKKPVSMNGKEHFCFNFRKLSSAAAPIINSNQIIGAVGIIINEETIHPHTYALIDSAAHLINNEYNFENMLKRKDKYQSAIIDSMTDGFLAIDNHGYLMYINDTGAEILSINKANSIGKHITELVDFKPVILDVLKTGVGYIDKEIIVTNKKGAKMHFIKTAVPIRDEDGNMIGVVDSFKKAKRVQKMVTDMVGAYAKFSFNNIIGKDERFKECIRLGEIATRSFSNVLIQGESGTGKELFAQAIHNGSVRKNQPFITINCAAIPRELIESELFGYEPGAFTGASKNGRPGKFELANGGTIFLDEIGDMPLDMQAKLLRVLQEKRINRIGGSNYFDIDVRVIAATNKNLIEECSQGSFRRDLYYRLNVLNIELTPLRERKGDIEELVNHFIRKMNIKLGKEINEATKGFMEFLLNYNWQGNVRELENVIERAVNICEDNELTSEHLPKSIKETHEIKGIVEVINVPEKIESLEEVEMKSIKRALQLMDGNISKTAEVLRVSRNTLYNKIKRYGLI